MDENNILGVCVGAGWIFSMVLGFLMALAVCGIFVCCEKRKQKDVAKLMPTSEGPPMRPLYGDYD